MKKILVIFLCVLFNCSFIIKAQNTPIVGELIIDFVDRPDEWDVSVIIQAHSTHWDCEHSLTDSYSGGFRAYNENSYPYHMHLSSACWITEIYEPFLALAKYRITVAQSNPHDAQVSFDFDWRTSDLPPGPGVWIDQHFEYSINQHKIYRYLDPNKISIGGQTLTIWDEIEEIILDTTNLEPYAPTNLTCTPWYGHPKLIWEHPDLSDDYRTGYEVWRNINGWEKITTQYPQHNLWVDWTFEIGSQYVQYKVRAINGAAVSDWSNTITLYPLFGKQSSGNIPAETLNYELYQNYPNPFNSTTHIRYTIPESDRITLKVYDLLGSEVSTLLDRYQERGEYDVLFRPDNLSSGIYFYEIRANNFRDVKKLILIR
jgi:hypothetical protein